VWNHGLLTCEEGGEPVHWPEAGLDVALEPGTRWPTHAKVDARDAQGRACTIAIEPGAKFFMQGLGYMHPEWNHGMNKGELAIGYDEIATAEVKDYAPPFQHVQAYAHVTLTSEDGEARRGAGAFEYILIGRHAPSGLETLFGVP
jgi:hypothetical protein